ncbi:MAG: hypothetical protein SP1CHLAM14_07600 [Chlamydiales bacterium]|nr:hypothetical protein [Chlamydiales bacterium]
MVLEKIDRDDVFLRENLNLLPASFLSAKDSEVLDRIMLLIRFFPDPHLYPSLLLALLRLPVSFKKVRTVAHLSRLIAAEYFYKRKVLKGEGSFRLLYVKLLPTKLEFPFGTKSVLGIVVVFNLMKQREAFEEQHVTEAVCHIIPGVKRIESSFVDYQDKQNQVHSVYLEIEHERGFSNDEIEKLKKELPNELKRCIEQLVPMTFMRRNEEEVYRNILALRDQLKSVRDIPQMTISFEEQTQFDLFFTVVLLRLVKGKEPSVRELVERSNPDIVYIPDRVDLVGSLRKHYQKEATVFRLQLPKSIFYRKDRSVNLYKARRHVVMMLSNALGQVRDYNGGLILKQNERLEDFLSIMPKYHDEFLLENFFYSVTPIAMQSILPASLVKEWFLTFSELSDRVIPKKKPYLLSFCKREEAIIVIVRSDDSSFKEELLNLVTRLKIPSLELAFSEVKIHGAYSFGFLYRPSQFGTEKLFTSAVKEVMEKWGNKVREQQTLAIALHGYDPSLDPRIAKGDQSYIVIKMLFEGLTRIGRDGKPQMAIAKSYEVSEDFKTYTFYLRDTKWSNGAPVTAHDFEYSWKKAITPHTQSAFSYTLFMIKNARLAKEKKIGLDQVGIHAVDDRTLVVDLEYPVPYFLEVVAHWTYSLINSLVDRMHPGWAFQAGEKYVCNGPFKLAEWKKGRAITVVKNPLYWDQKEVKLSKISIHMIDSGQNELRMMETNELDMAGRPMTTFPLSGFEHTLDEVDLISYPLFGVFALSFNTMQFPFNHKKIRQAFAYAIDYTTLPNLVPHEYGGPCCSILPTQLSLHTQSLSPMKDLKKARALFREGLGEIGFVKSDFPRLTLSFHKRMHREQLFNQLKHQWKEAFGIEIHLEGLSWGEQFDRMIRGKYQFGAVEQRAFWHDPLHLLDRFQKKSNLLNLSFWENQTFQAAMKRGLEKSTIEKRDDYLRDAEKVLVEEMPMIPLYQLSGNYLKRRGVKGVYASEFFQADFKWAFKEL